MYKRQICDTPTLLKRKRDPGWFHAKRHQVSHSNRKFDLSTSDLLNSTADTFGDETRSILSRTKAMLPALDSTDTEILIALSGLRPSREGGARVEREDASLKDRGHRGVIVHNYGAGGTGFQAGYGMAVEAVSLVSQELHGLAPQASL